MIYVLDTNAVSALMKGNVAFVERLASQAPSAKLVTANLDHMARVPGLQIEDWSQ